MIAVSSHAYRVLDETTETKYMKPTEHEEKAGLEEKKMRCYTDSMAEVVNLTYIPLPPEIANCDVRSKQAQTSISRELQELPLEEAPLRICQTLIEGLRLAKLES